MYIEKKSHSAQIAYYIEYRKSHIETERIYKANYLYRELRYIAIYIFLPYHLVGGIFLRFYCATVQHCYRTFYGFIPYNFEIHVFPI